MTPKSFQNRPWGAQLAPIGAPKAAGATPDTKMYKRIDEVNQNRKVYV